MAEREQTPKQEERAQAEKRPREERVYRGTGIYGSAVFGFLLAVATIIFIAQNTESVTIEWLVWDLSISLAAVVLAAMLLSVLLGIPIGLVWRRRRRRMLKEREELERLRSAGDGKAERRLVKR